jgi:hypothetical protein
MNSKSSEVRVVSNLILVAFIFFLEEGFEGETFLFFEGSSSSLGDVTSTFFCSTLVPSISPPSPPCSGEIEGVCVEVLWASWASSFFLVFLCPGVSYAASGLSTSESSVGSAGIRRFVDHSVVIYYNYSSISL